MTTVNRDTIGYWSEVKLAIVRECAQAYSRVLTSNYLHHVYIDAFAGAGMHVSKKGQALREALTAVKDAKTGLQKFAEEAVDVMVEFAETKNGGWDGFSAPNRSQREPKHAYI